MRIGRIAATALLVTLTACGGGDDGGGDEKEQAEAATNATDKIKDGVSSITKTVEVTEDNDPNNAIGRPGSYQEATVFYDSRLECPEGEPVHVDCGAKTEVFDDEATAKKRRDYLASVTEGMAGIVTEYDYLDGNVLLRVSGELKPSEAAEYEAAFAG